MNAHNRRSIARASRLVEPTFLEELTEQQRMADDDRRVDIVTISRRKQSTRFVPFVSVSGFFLSLETQIYKIKLRRING